MANKRRKGGKIGRPPKIIVNTDGIEATMPVKHIRKCGSCNENIGKGDNVLAWETMEFCKKTCLETFQNEIGSKCKNCNAVVKPVRIGKLCVRIGCEISQFCSAACLSKYREEAKVCSQCHKDVTHNQSAVFADVGSGECKDFCSEVCKLKYITKASRNSNTQCVTCNRQAATFELDFNEKTVGFCGSVCYNSYKYSHNVTSGQCKSCHNYFDVKVLQANSMYSNGETFSFCSSACKNRYINKDKTIVQCSTCNIKKYLFDLIQWSGTESPITVCSLKCLNVQQVTSSSSTSTPSSNLSSQGTATSIVNNAPNKRIEKASSTSLPLKFPELPPLPRNVATMCKTNVASVDVATDKIATVTKSTQKEVKTNSVEVQTDISGATCIPIPIPIYIPLPMMMYSAPFPVPFPFPVPLPVPIFVPTSKRTYKSVAKRVKKILDRSLKDPLQDEMLMLAEMASKDCKGGISSSDSDTETEEEEKPVLVKAPSRRSNGRGGRRAALDNNVNRAPARRPRMSKQKVQYSDYDNHTGEDVPKGASKRNNKRVSFDNDIENDRDKQSRNNKRVVFAEQTNEMVSPYATLNNPSEDENTDDAFDDSIPYDQDDFSAVYREPSANRMNDYDEKGFVKHRKRRKTSPTDSDIKPSFASEPISSPMPHSNFLPPQKPLPSLHEVHKKPDNEMHLKYFIGVSAWQQWSQTKHPGKFNPDILKLNCEDLDTSLCLFINEVQKPNGQIYTPDTIYYFCLGIQQHLFLNGRTDNIFYNSVYKRFTDCLDEISRKFLVLYNDSDFIVTRIEEEHLWESKQLGAHSPQVLLNTLLFFNTKYFNLTMIEEHRNLYFSHIVKNVKYTNLKTGRTRSVVLRYTPNGREPPPQQGKSRKKKNFEQYENEENPLRCPIRLYEFYISKCPDNIKGTNVCFYLLPVSSCLPESSVWYSSTMVPDYELDKVLNRFKIVREITMALLAK